MISGTIHVKKKITNMCVWTDKQFLMSMHITNLNIKVFIVEVNKIEN